MRFSRFLWGLWAQTEEGTAALDRWYAWGAGLRDGTICRSKLVARDGSSPDVSARRMKLSFQEIRDRELDPMASVWVVDACGRKNVRSPQDARAIYQQLLERGVEVTNADGESYTVGGDEVRPWAHEVTSLSLGFWAAHPERFVPYLFRRQFSLFREIADEFEIAVPDPPGEQSWDRRALYYLDLNDALLEFGRRFDLRPVELAAFLNDFARHHVASEEDADLPPPRAVWWQHGGVDDNGDFDLLDAAGNETKHHWQGNDQARRGDVAVMWCLSPRSYVHSIWRVTRDGHYDPFSYFSRIVEMGHPIIDLPKVSFAELAADPTFSQWPATRAHFQGASGRELPPPMYEALLDIYHRRSVNTSRLPRVEPIGLPDGVHIRSERDVEEKLLEPLLAGLGYTERLWRRGLALRMGRGERYFTDYAVGVRGKPGMEQCKLVAEAKRTISTPRALLEAFRQARSYALRLDAGVILLVAWEGFWIAERSASGFPEPKIDERFSWADTSSATKMAAIRRRIGARALGVTTRLSS